MGHHPFSEQSMDSSNSDPFQEQDDENGLVKQIEDNGGRKYDELQQQMEEIKNENEFLVSNKNDLLNQTSKQIEIMRDKLDNMAKQLLDRERTIKELIHINKEGYNPDDDQKSEVSWMGISNSVKNGILTFGRSKFSATPKKTLAETKKA